MASPLSSSHPSNDEEIIRIENRRDLRTDTDTDTGSEINVDGNGDDDGDGDGSDKRKRDEHTRAVGKEESSTKTVNIAGVPHVPLNGDSRRLRRLSEEDPSTTSGDVDAGADADVDTVYSEERIARNIYKKKKLSTASPSSTPGFRMQIHGLPRKRKRERETAGSPNMGLSSSSSSSSDEEDPDGGGTRRGLKPYTTTTTTTTTPRSPQHTLSQHSECAPLSKEEDLSPKENLSSSPSSKSFSQQQQQHHHQLQSASLSNSSKGWRVKLYRLNADGSWDDCGTGSISCLYKKTGQHHHPATTATTNPSSSTGDAWVYHKLGEPTMCMQSEIKGHGSAHSTGGNITSSSGTGPPKILLRTRILLRDAYQRQGDNIITWCEPYLEEGNPAQGVDLALSFQDIAGCHQIWQHITQVQSKAAELFRKRGGASNGSNSNNHGNQSGEERSTAHDIRSRSGSGNIIDSPEGKGSGSVDEMAPSAAQSQHATLQRQQQQEMWVNVASEAAKQHLDHQNAMGERNREHHFAEEGMNGGGYHENNATGAQSVSPNTPQSPRLPIPPGLSNLEEVADTIAAVQHMQQRESLAMFISQNECSYLKSLLSLFPSAESRGDYGSLATLAACVKTILLLNDPSIIELIVSDELIFEEVCSTLEYDPDLRDKANHRWFLRERAKFRTVVLMEDEELVASIHRAFRVNYLRDTLLRPTMDESSLSTLSSLQTFTHADVVKGVTMSPAGSDEKGALLKDSYLAKIIRNLGRELEAICDMEWKELESLPHDGDIQALICAQSEEPPTDTSTVVVTGKYPQSQKFSRVWKQYLAPQDDSLASRRIRRRGCVSFLREMFNMVRVSLQQSDKDDFFAVLVSMDVDLDYEPGRPQKRRHYSGGKDKHDTFETKTSTHHGKNPKSPSRSVNLLSLLGTVLADPNMDVTEKGSVLEIISGIAMHDPSLIRRRCLDTFVTWRRQRKTIRKYLDAIGPIRPHANEKRQVLFHCPPNDLLGSLMYLLAMETDAGVLLQVSEIMRIVLDTDMMTDHGPMGGGFADEALNIPPAGGHTLPHEQHVNPSNSLTTSSDQNQFLSMFYDHYVQWLAAPLQYKILFPVHRIPRDVLEAQRDSPIVTKMIERFEKGRASEDQHFHLVTKNAIRSSFAVELLSFCVRAHLYRMKCYLLRSRILGNVLKVLNKPDSSKTASGERCLTLAALRFLRSILSVNDEFYHRHIIQHNLFSQVFAAFRANPVGDNLVSSTIVEMCDFIQNENIKSLVEHIVTKHLSPSSERPTPSLEDVSSPYVSTLTTLRCTYEKNLHDANKPASDSATDKVVQPGESHSGYFHSSPTGRSPPVALNEKAREDQRKFRQVDQEESYFDDDDDDGPTTNTVVPPGVDEVAAQEAERDIQRAPRVFPLTQAPLLNSNALRLDDKVTKDLRREANGNESSGVVS